MMKRIVWAAVVSALLAVVSVVLAVLGHESESIAFGMAAVVSAILSNRERV
jgi:hypothetical protein